MLFDSVCKILNVQLDLKDAKLGLALVSSIRKRVSFQRLRSRLQFANAQLFGRSMRLNLRDFNRHIASGRKVLSEGIVSALDKPNAALSARQVLQGVGDHVRI